MVSLKRNKQTLYLCKQKIENNITKYSEPIEIKTNYTPTNSTGEIIGIGTEYSLYLKIKDTKEICNNFSNGDRWEAIKCTENARGKKCNISYI